LVVVTLLAALWLSGAIEDRLMRAGSLHSTCAWCFSRLAAALLVLLTVLIVRHCWVSTSRCCRCSAAPSLWAWVSACRKSPGIQRLHHPARPFDPHRRLDHRRRISTAGEKHHHALRGSACGRWTRAIIPNELLIATTVLNHSYSNRQILLKIRSGRL
jgi:hypothetical protein